MILKKASEAVEAVRAVAEQAGVIAPNVAALVEAAEQHRRDLTVAYKSIENAEQALQSAFDSDAENAEIKRLEAALASAKLEAHRAEGRYTGAEKRLRTAQEADAARAKAAMRARLDVAIDARARAAERIDATAREMAQAMADLESHDKVVWDALEAGVLPRHADCVIGVTSRVVELALKKAGALQNDWLGDKAESPSAARIIARDNEILSGNKE